MLKDIQVPTAKIAKFCRRWHITRLAFFGSVLTDEFGPESDLDVLVEFEPGRVPGLDFVDAEDEFSEIIGRKVHLSTPQCLSRYFRGKVIAEAEALYGQ